MRAVGDPSLAWRTEAHLLGLIYDTLQGANWQRAGNSKLARPTPLTRPGMAEPSKGLAVPLDELRRKLHPELEQEGGTDGD